MNRTSRFFEQPAFILIIFIFFQLLLLLPLLCFKFFPTVDGPAHLYNATLIRGLLEGDPFYHSFFHFNMEPVPNWTGHLAMVGTGYLLPAWAVEKMVLLLITILTPVSVICFMKAAGARIQWTIFMLLPFTYTITLYLGFFNFLLSIPVMFFTLAMVIKAGNKIPVVKLSLMLLLLYFTHIFGFALALLIVVVFTGYQIVTRNGTKRAYTMICVAFLPGILMALIFFTGRGVEGFRDKVEHIPLLNLLKGLLSGSPLVSLNGDKELLWTRIFMLLITLLGFMVMGARIVKKSRFQKADLLLVISLIMLICYFIIPDGIASGGFVSLRLQLLCMLFLVMWILWHQLPVGVSLLTSVICILVVSGPFYYRMEVARSLSRDVTQMMVLSAEIKEPATVLPLNYSENWLHINLSNYLGAEKRIVVMDNYEALLDEFPLLWNSHAKPGNRLGNFAQSLNPEIEIEKYESETKIKIDYLTRWNFEPSSTDSIAVKTSIDILRRFRPGLESGNGELFYRW